MHPFIIFALIFFSSCGLKELISPVEIEEEQSTLDHLTKAQAERIADGKAYTNENGWITPDDCDGMIWSAKFGAFAGGFEPEAAEYDEPGKFGRRPPPWCWTPELADPDSASEWSRDMAVAGLYPFIWLTNRLDLISRHIQYGEGHQLANMVWSMGDPAADGRAIYNPGLVGLSYQLRWALGGSNDARRHTPTTYTKGLDDYQAHLQMMNIWLRGEFVGGITEKMYARVQEHVEREPYNPLYQYIAGTYSGNMDNAVELCKNADSTVGSYVRCNETRACEIAERVFACGLVIRAIEKG